jgi:dienelactone hydrolase
MYPRNPSGGLRFWFLRHYYGDSAQKDGLKVLEELNGNGRQVAFPEAPALCATRSDRKDVTTRRRPRVFRVLGRAVAAAVFCIIATGTARPEQLTARGEWQGRQIPLQLTFEKPAGTGPFAVVILLPGCSAELDSGLNVWASQLRSWGYATLLVEGAESRGLGNICGNLDTMKLMFVETSRDVFRAAFAIAHRPDVKPNKIAVLGRSLGSNSIVWYLSRDLPLVNQAQARAQASGVRILAGVAITPNCENGGRVAVTMPLLILAGERDDWNVAARCSELASAPENAANTRIKVYPGAYHGFDRPGRPLMYFGHHVEYNPAATQDAYAQARQFLDQYLR